MRHIYELDEKEITQAIAEKYGCSISAVRLNIVSDTTGYGLSERTEHHVAATITSEINIV